MKSSESNAIVELLEVMKRKSGGNAPPWSPDDPAYYTRQVENWSADLIHAVAERVRLHMPTWRPDVATLYAVASEVAAPLPAEFALRQELTYLAFHRARIRAETIVLDGRESVTFAPVEAVVCSHPLLAQIAEALDGIDAVRGMLTNASNRDMNDFRHEFRRAYEYACACWRRDVIDQLTRPQSAREAKFFQTYPVWAPPVQQTVRQAEVARTENPEKLRAIIHRFSTSKL